MHYDEERERYILDVPTECPKCGEQLELDINIDSTYLFCDNSKCDQEEIDVTEEFKQVEEANKEFDEIDEEGE